MHLWIPWRGERSWNRSCPFKSSSTRFLISFFHENVILVVSATDFITLRLLCTLLKCITLSRSVVSRSSCFLWFSSISANTPRDNAQTSSITARRTVHYVSPLRNFHIYNVLFLHIWISGNFERHAKSCDYSFALLIVSKSPTLSFSDQFHVHSCI